MVSSLHQTVQCQCGKIQLAIDSPSVLRLVCYSQDYRGYYTALNEKAEAKNQPTNAKLDAWGGVDLTQIYVSSYSSYYVTEHVIFQNMLIILLLWTGLVVSQPSEIKVRQGGDLLQTCLIRKQSPIRRVYASCCHTPMFDIGGLAAMLNTHLINDTSKPEIRFRIIGRQAHKATDSKMRGLKRPNMSWSIPLAWTWTMGKRIDKTKMEPVPVDVSNPNILENFKEG